MSEIHAAALTTFSVDADGDSVRINVRDRAGEPAALVLPAKCAYHLLMTLPRMLETALRNRHDDESLRLVYPLEGFTLEAGETSVRGVPQFILTLDTEGGFSVSFSGSEDMLASVARAIFADVPAYPFIPRAVQYRS